MQQGAGNRGASAQPAFDLRVVLFAGVGLLAAALLSVGYFDDDRSPKRPGEQNSLMTTVAAAEAEQAIARLLLSEAQKEQVREDVSRGRLRLAWIKVSDNLTEDGDWIRLEAAGFRQDIRLLHQPYQIAVPYLPGSTATVTGLVDGIDGDITVSVSTGGGLISLKPLKQGETLQIPTP
ncbi:hypothetical protein [Hyphomicrobium sp. NDB2Meth4]|uniref:hypothetical protein n=1 Tax=Hyphomicrobium sp. NDB2Meth4 TaxID=1892846 RepID=UPI000931AF85|nr:hypothetical protein [Hyphomicrobium sp. NDB2Meth4]